MHSCIYLVFISLIGLHVLQQVQLLNVANNQKAKKLHNIVSSSPVPLSIKQHQQHLRKYVYEDVVTDINNALNIKSICQQIKIKILSNHQQTDGTIDRIFSDDIQQKRSVLANQKIEPRKVQRRDIPLLQPPLGLEAESVNDKSQGKTSPISQTESIIPKIPVSKSLIKPNETEAERAERIHKSFERLLTFVEIVGQVDNYVSSKWKNLVKTVSNFYEVEDEPYRVSARRIYGPCGHSH